MTPKESIDRYIASELERLQEASIRSLCVVGEQAVNAAKSAQGPDPSTYRGRRIPPHQPNFIDWTANLRSSIGYVVVIDGKVVNEKFEQVKDGNDGVKEGASFARSLAKKFPQGVCLILVAGMEYAYYVKKRGYDVIDSGELLARNLVPKLLKQLGYKV